MGNTRLPASRDAPRRAGGARRATAARPRTGGVGRPAAEALEARALLSASTVDTSFSGDGRAELFVGDRAQFTAVTVLPDGRVLAAGTADMLKGAGFQNDFLVARFTAAGNLDTTFGGGKGWVNTNFYPFASTGQSQDFAAAIVQLPGSKFAIAGNSHDGASLKGRNFAVARYNANGSLDTSFSGDGKVTVDFASGSEDQANAMALTSDGKLLAVGSSNSYTPGGTYADVAVARLNANGSLDTSFGGGTGKVKRDFGTVFGPDGSTGNDDRFADQVARAVAVLPNGRFLVAGSIGDSSQAGATRTDLMVAGFGQGGGLDTSFGAGGRGFVQTNAGPDNESFYSLTVLRDGRILAGGTAERAASDPFSHDFVLARYTAGGSLDSSFGAGGTAKTDFNDFGQAGDTMRSALVQPNGKILAVGSSQPNDTEQPARTAMARYNANGTLDTSFSGDGKLVSGIISNGGALAAASAPDGKTVVAGTTGSVAVVGRFGADAAATASVSGTFYKDTNGNGVRNSGEPVLAGWQAFVDQNNDGFYTPGERIATSNSAGVYKLIGLPPGTYRIREIRQAGWARTQPAGPYPLGYYDLTVGLGQSVFGKDFGNRLA
jgi:uncharacterized delta-60 repeat protein